MIRKSNWRFIEQILRPDCSQNSAQYCTKLKLCSTDIYCNYNVSCDSSMSLCPQTRACQSSGLCSRQPLSYNSSGLNTNYSVTYNHAVTIGKTGYLSVVVTDNVTILPGDKLAYSSPVANILAVLKGDAYKSYEYITSLPVSLNVGSFINGNQFAATSRLALVQLSAVARPTRTYTLATLYNRSDKNVNHTVTLKLWNQNRSGVAVVIKTTRICVEESINASVCILPMYGIVNESVNVSVQQHQGNKKTESLNSFLQKICKYSNYTICTVHYLNVRFE